MGVVRISGPFGPMLADFGIQLWAAAGQLWAVKWYQLEPVCSLGPQLG